MCKITNVSCRRPANQLAVAGLLCNKICVEIDILVFAVMSMV